MLQERPISVMDARDANNLVNQISKLGAISASFHATFGIHYKLVKDSPDEAWAFVRQSMNAQTTISHYLDYASLLRPYIKWKRWWETDAIIPIALTHELLADGYRIIFAVAYKTQGQDDAEYLTRLQENIAGALHPIARSEALKRHPQKPRET